MHYQKTYTLLGDTMTPEEIKREMKLKRSRNLKLQKESNKIWTVITIKLFITIFLTLGIMIGLKQSKDFKKNFYEQVYDTNFTFAYVNNVYQKLFGSPIPFSNYLKEPVKATFKEQLTFKKEEAYKDGVKLTVDDRYLVPVKNSGLVVFIGEKEGYGKTVIVEQMNGTDLWYGGLKDINVKLYDYVEEGSLLGEVEENILFLVFKKEGKVLNYQDCM